MKNATVSSLGFDLNKQVPESVAEYDQLARRPNAALEDAVDSCLYRGTFAEFRSLFLHGCDEDDSGPALVGVDKQTGIDRLTKVTKNAKGEEVEVWDESEAVYWKRVVATKFGGDIEAAVREFQSHAQAAMDRAAFDPSVKERKAAGPKTIAKTYIAIAKQAVADGKGQRLADLLAGHLGRAVALTGDVDTDVATLSRAIADREAQKRAALKAEYAV